MFCFFTSIKGIRNLIRELEESDTDELEVSSFGRKIRIKKITLASCQELFVQTISEKNNEPPKLVYIKSPRVGTIHLEPLEPPPDSELPEHKFKPLKVGQRVQKGQIVCLIKAMNLSNEITSEVAGLVIEILIKDEDPIEFSQPLFLIDPEM